MMIDNEKEEKVSSSPEDRKKVREKSRKKKRKKILLIIFFMMITSVTIPSCLIWIEKAEFEFPVLRITGMETGSAIAEYDHNNLNNLEWSIAGHTIDIDFDIGNYSFVTIGNSSASYFIGDGSFLWNVNYSVSTYVDTVSINVVNGLGTGTSTLLNYEILQLIVTPASSGNTYNFEAYETATANIVDRNRITHTGTWNIRKNIPIASSTITYNITGASIDESFSVAVRYTE